MVFKKNKSGQAAIEFLMTYGWMLLVVLIVGALIFSFVDFGSLLPSKLDLSNNLKGDPTGSVAYASISTSNPDQVKVVFNYVGGKKALITPEDAVITTELGDKCYGIRLENLNTKGLVNVTKMTFGPPNTFQVTTGEKNDTPFLNGHKAIMTFDCNQTGIITYSGTDDHGITGGLLNGDTVSGTISILVKDPITGLPIPSTGPIRVSVIK